MRLLFTDEKRRKKNVGHEQLVNTALPSKTRKPEFEM
jgi:hypothetical protein